MGVTAAKLLPITIWIARIAAAFILLQTVFFKFTGAPESIALFETIGMEPWGRYGSGALELVAAVLLLLPAARFAATGSVLALGLMTGAIFLHLTKLGIEVQGDGGTLFAMAIVVLVSSGFVLLHNRQGLRAWCKLAGSGRGPASGVEA